MIVIGFDYGLKKIGVAVGENITKKARPISVLNAKNGYPNWNIIKNLFEYWEPKFIIVGLPLNIDGTKQNITNQSEKFAYLLKCKFNILTKMHDERLTTVEAKSIIFKKRGFKALQKKETHSLSAAIILESWLDQNLSKI
ncbi:Holliday junction resolvase RuvX [Buchnera aphidicola]|uniref:Putative pre-16S rRNA nuclease n=1 Tax=Buchnera aphidicola str. USDA (Myzus persicae) TaxID=1009856 RepID=W0P3B3_BUCMP|nr:Holliday junction resolvase RuvX [Buchnera aphidicola]AHG59855.1 Yqgf [Buchnera aphidicola str. USDA (Myzus persicae)]AHG60435.1 Yqgf [Buchnera aphidicola str. W106 (Myzus persicae)]AHG61008.1 Yqgf [Buchnera aphidicola str. G002 (Myzus persicae)]AHG61580.1 Yqgf [Buchnera aphidicola str. F009 (Myzus persicae)]WAI02906.1 MAG: Holliday junction resolvase RuvX [Buchnera aphidicola (Myzus persicae)]